MTVVQTDYVPVLRQIQYHWEKMASREGFLPPITAHRDRVLAVSGTFPYDTEHL